MYFNNLTINIMTLGGLALGAGMLVDNAIVVLENIIRNHEEGTSFKEAVVNGTGQVGSAITASTITTVVVFLPIVYLHGASGEMFKDQAWTVAFALLSSLFVALLIIPMLVSKLFPGVKQTADNISAPVHFGWYKRILEKIIERRGIVILLSVLLLAGTGLLIPRLGSEFMPAAESAEFTLNIELPVGTSLERTHSTAAQIENTITGLLPDRIKMIYMQAGEDKTSSISQSSTVKGENTASLKVFLDDSYSGYTSDAIILVESYLKNIPEMNFSFSRQETSLQSSLGTTEAPFALEVSGKEYSEIERILNESKAILSENPSLYNLTTSMDEGTPQVEVLIDRFRTSYYSITAENIVNQIRSYLSGSPAGSFEKDGELKDITIKLGDLSLAQLKDLPITAGTARIPLSELADIRIVTSPREITRRNQSRTSYIYSMVRDDMPFDKVIKGAEASLKGITLPADYKLEFTGEELKRKESMSNLSFALMLSLILVFMVLAAQFESVIQPFTIMLTIPLAGVGTILTFLIFGKSLNMMAYIGIIMLGGIAVNNAIILDRISEVQANPYDKPYNNTRTSSADNRLRGERFTEITHGDGCDRRTRLLHPADTYGHTMRLLGIRFTGCFSDGQE